MQRLSIGEQLIEAREAHHLSLRGVARRLRIHERYLQALEDNRFADVPSGAYVLGFLRNYTILLGLSYKDLKAQLLEEHPTILPAETPQPYVGNKKASGFVLTPGKLIAVIALVGTIIVVGYMGIQYQRLTKAPSLTVYTPLGGAVYDSNVEISGVTDPGSDLLINDEAVSIDSAGNFTKEFVVLKNGPETIRIVARNRISNRETVVPITFQVALPTSTVVTPNDTVETSATNPDKLVLELRTTAEVWMLVTIDREEGKDLTLSSGEQQTFEASDSITIYSQRPYAIVVRVNGGEEEIMGQTQTERTWSKGETDGE
jgi:cytoskeletal protein RodZ